MTGVEWTQDELDFAAVARTRGISAHLTVGEAPGLEPRRQLIVHREAGVRSTFMDPWVHTADVPAVIVTGDKAARSAWLNELETTWRNDEREALR